MGVAVVARDYTIEAINAAARQMLSIPSVGVGQDFLHAIQDVPYAEVRRTIDETSGKRGPHRPTISPSNTSSAASPPILGSPATPGAPRSKGNG